MSELVLTELNKILIEQLQKRASRHGRTPADEAKAILSDALRVEPQRNWASVDAIYERLSASQRPFSDSAELLREDRDR